MWREVTLYILASSLPRRRFKTSPYQHHHFPQVESKQMPSACSIASRIYIYQVHLYNPSFRFVSTQAMRCVWRKSYARVDLSNPSANASLNLTNKQESGAALQLLRANQESDRVTMARNIAQILRSLWPKFFYLQHALLHNVCTQTHGT